MSIEFVTGLPGHGKTLFNVHSIVRRLESTDRRQVTTLTELKLPELTHFINKRNPKRGIDLPRRLSFIEKGNTAQFYRYRGEFTLPPPPRLAKDMSDAERDALLSQYFEPLTKGRGVDYVLTEAHRHFRSEAWSEMAAVTMFYLTQHRHFDDNVTIETQLPKQVVVQLRDLADECHELRNHYREQFGWFRKPGKFKVRHFYRVPKTDSAEPYRTTEFKLDPEGFANCYRTRGAVGEGTDTPETDPKPKALPFWTIWAAVALALVLLPLVIWGVIRGTGKALGAVMSVTADATADVGEGAFGEQDKPTPKPPKPPGGAWHEQPAWQPPPSSAAQPVVKAGQKLPPAVTGYMQAGDRLVIQLDDGTTRQVGTGAIETFHVRGQAFKWKATKSDQRLTAPQKSVESGRNEEIQPKGEPQGSPPRPGQAGERSQ